MDNKCTACGANNAIDSKECKYCGEALVSSYAAAQAQSATAVQQPMYQQPMHQQQQGYQQPMQQQPAFQQTIYQQQPMMQYPPPYEPTYIMSNKSKVVAGLLGIFLGGLGIHKFYLGRIGQGIIYLLFCWTYLPSLIGFIEGIIYLCSNEENFARKYGKRIYRG